MTTRSCASCEFSQAAKDAADYVECRRRAPPGISHFADLSAIAGWPRTRPTDWCGDYELAATDKRRRAA
jgi:hypothetical protein